MTTHRPYPDLLVISSATGDIQDGGLLLDKKFVEGMRFYADAWPGRAACLVRQGSEEMPFAGAFDPEALPFEVLLRPRGHHIESTDLDGYHVILCSGDNADYLHLADLVRKSGKAIHFTIEYIPQTRRQIVMLDPKRSLPSKLKSLLWLAKQEHRRRRAFRRATGLQANGYPAATHYRQINPRTLLYFDNRIDRSLMATGPEMVARRHHLLSGGPLRLIHSGRLEPMKGSQDLIPIARRLRDQRVDFTLEIFGTGSLELQIRQQIADYGLDDHVRLVGVLDFASELVPHLRRHGDIYLSCHRQSDPSCTYLENMGCGLAVAGYANRMWEALAKESGAGWVAPLGNTAALAKKLAELATRREEIADRSARALDFCQAHSFEEEFSRRMEQLKCKDQNDGRRQQNE